MATVAELVEEVVTLVSTLPAFTDPNVVKSFSIFNLDDLKSIAEFGGLPIVGVAYEGANVVDNSANPVARKAHSAALYTVRISVIIAMEYGSAAGVPDPKPDATNLLDEARGVLLGYKGINSRPWRLIGESPMTGELEGVIFYGQIWETEIPIVGTFTQP